MRPEKILQKDTGDFLKKLEKRGCLPLKILLLIKKSE